MTGCFMGRQITGTGSGVRRGAEVSLGERVSEIMHREWRCVFDFDLLEGMVFESILGRARSCLLSIGDCRARRGELGLPSAAEIAAAAREAVRSGGKS